jgi:hypothetical protein
VPADLRPGRVRVIILVPEEDEAGEAWERGVARQWAVELSDVREDIYTVNDGEPEDAAGSTWQLSRSATPPATSC